MGNEQSRRNRRIQKQIASGSFNLAATKYCTMTDNLQALIYVAISLIEIMIYVRACLRARKYEPRRSSSCAIASCRWSMRTLATSRPRHYSSTLSYVNT